MSPTCDVLRNAGAHNFEQFKLGSPSGGAGSPIAVGGAAATPRQSQLQHTGPGRLAQQLQQPTVSNYQQGQHNANDSTPGQQPASWRAEDAAQQNSTRQWPGNLQQQAMGPNSMGSFNKHPPHNQGTNKGNQDAGWGAAAAGSVRLGNSGGAHGDASTPPNVAAGQGGVMRFARH